MEETPPEALDNLRTPEDPFSSERAEISLNLFEGGTLEIARKRAVLFSRQSREDEDLEDTTRRFSATVGAEKELSKFEEEELARGIVARIFQPGGEWKELLRNLDPQAGEFSEEKVHNENQALMSEENPRAKMGMIDEIWMSASKVISHEADRLAKIARDGNIAGARDEIRDLNRNFELRMSHMQEDEKKQALQFLRLLRSLDDAVSKWDSSTRARFQDYCDDIWYPAGNIRRAHETLGSLYQASQR